MNIVLIYPPIQEYTKFWLPHLGLGYLAGILERHNYNVKVIDCVAERFTMVDLKERIRRMKMDVLCVTATTPEIVSAHDICRIAKSDNQNILTVVGGPHVTALPGKTLEEFPFFDVAIAGEGEYALLEVLEKSINERSFSEVRGVTYRNGDRVIQNQPPEYISDLDKIPFPLWSSFPLGKYRGMLEFFKKLEFPIITGRGCPYRCIFCQRALGQRVRYRSIGSVIEEIKYDISLGARSLYFCDETFSFNKKRALEICGEISQHGLDKKISWSCETRVDRVDEELLLAMKEAGCALVSFGVESGNEEILRNSEKGITLGQIREAFRLCRKIKLSTYMFLIFGLPYETEQTLRDSMNLIRELSPDYLTIGILVPFPGTEVYQMAKREMGGMRLTAQSWADYGKQMGEAIGLESIPTYKLHWYQTKAYVEFYIRPKRLFNLLKMASLPGIMQLVRARVRETMFKPPKVTD